MALPREMMVEGDEVYYVFTQGRVIWEIQNCILKYTYFYLKMYGSRKIMNN
jgi:hypothetical protein